MRTNTGLLAALVLATAALPCSAAVLNVPADHVAIDSALSAAVSGDTVQVAPGTYFEHDLILPSGVTLRGETGDPADVVIDSERLGRCIYGADLDASTRIEALTLSNGLPAWGDTPHNSWGAGLMVDGGGPTVADCIFTANETAIGGGAYVEGTGSPTFLRCVFDGNTASEAAGMQITGICSPVVRDCDFRNGYRCMMGGGLTFGVSGTALVENCTFENNAVIESGGAVEVFGSQCWMTLRNCVMRNNTVDRYSGAGVYVGNSGHAVLENCEITGNAAGGYGAGVYVDWGSTFEATATTIRNNTAPSTPQGYVNVNGSAVLHCCDTDQAGWGGDGSIVFDDEGCGASAETASWGRVKAMFR